MLWAAVDGKGEGNGCLLVVSGVRGNCEVSDGRDFGGVISLSASFISTSSSFLGVGCPSAGDAGVIATSNVEPAMASRCLDIHSSLTRSSWHRLSSR